MERLTEVTDAAAEAVFWSLEAEPQQRIKALRHYLFGDGGRSAPEPERLSELAAHAPDIRPCLAA